MNIFRSETPLSAWLPRDAAADIEEQALEHPGWADYQNRWGLLLVMRGELVEAGKVFDRCLGINSGYAWASINRIQALALAGNTRDASKALETAPEPAEGVLAFVAAFLDLLNTDPDRGLERLAGLPADLQDRPDVGRLRAALCYCRSRDEGSKRWEAVAGEYADLRGAPVVPWDDDGSMESRMVTFVPGMHELFLALSNLAAGRGSLRAAAECAEILRLFWWDESAYLGQRGFLASFEGHGDQAVEFYDRAIQFNPRSARGHIALAYHWSSMGEIEEARHSLTDALQLAPNYADLHYQMGLLQRASNETELALESFRKALAINPDYIMARMQEAAALFARRDWAGSCRSYQKVIEAGVESADIYTQLGQAYTEMDQLDEAEESFARAAELVPDEYMRKRTA